MAAPVVLVAEELSPAGLALLETFFDVRYADGANREQLLAALPDADAVVVRSATRSMRRPFRLAAGCASSPGRAWAWTTLTWKRPPRQA